MVTDVRHFNFINWFEKCKPKSKYFVFKNYFFERKKPLNYFYIEKIELSDI